MSTAAILAKAAAALLPDEKGRKTAGTILLVVLFILMIPILAAMYSTPLGK